MARFLLLLTLAACSLGIESDDKKPADEKDDTADTDVDDTAPDTDDSGGGAIDISTYEGFVEAHAAAYCSSLEACGYLDERGFTDRPSCITGTVSRLGALTCTAYQPDVAQDCVRQDLRMERACEEFPGGAEPRACREVCNVPE